MAKAKNKKNKKKLAELSPVTKHANPSPEIAELWARFSRDYPMLAREAMNASKVAKAVMAKAEKPKSVIKAQKVALAKWERDTDQAMAAQGTLQAERASASVHTAIAKMAGECDQLRYAQYKADQLRRAEKQEKQRQDRLSGTPEMWLSVDAARERGIVRDDPLLNIGPGIYGRV